MADFSKYGIFPEKGRNYENIAYVLALIYNICEKRVDKLLSSYNLTLAKYNLLLVVRFQAKEEGITQVEIGRRLIVTAGNITKLITALAKENLIEAKQNKNNRRENLVKITKKGFDLIEEVWPVYNSLIKEITDLIPEKDQNKLANILADWFLKLQEVGK